MARLNLISGEIRGSVGGLTGQKWNSLNVLKAKTSPANPKTEAQQTHREGFGRATALGVPLVRQVYSYYSPKKKKSQTNFNYFMALNREFINSGGQDPALLRLTDGNLPGIKTFSVQESGVSPSDVRLTPDMTGLNTPAPFEITSSGNRGNTAGTNIYSHYWAFDGTLPDPDNYDRAWESASPSNAWICVKLGNPRPLKRAELWNRAYPPPYTLMPKNWIIQGSGDGIIFTDVLAGYFPPSSDGSGAKHDIFVGNDTPYLYYRFFCVDGYHADFISIAELRYYHSVVKTFHVSLEAFAYGDASPGDLIVIGAINLENREAVITDVRRADSPLPDFPLGIGYKPGDRFLVYAFCTDGKAKVSKSAQILYTIP
ncbi:MAG: discoidin domain-containing protein [Spirochaetaceae bacterium]|jgi:hypothetical protein|nr:discoidin domain-containing protein [Spirochaetaceae bacterium]